jgi:putative transposase
MDLSPFVRKFSWKKKSREGRACLGGDSVLWSHALMGPRSRTGSAPDGTTERRSIGGVGMGRARRRRDARVRTIELAIPKVRPGRISWGAPALLARGACLLAVVVRESYVHGVSTRKVDDDVAGLDGLSTSEVSRICGELDRVLAAVRARLLIGEHR